MSFWSAIGGMASSAGSSLLGKLVGYPFERSLQGHQINASFEGQRLQAALNEKLYKNRYQWMVEDMRKAGLNPILAASGGFNPGGGPSVSLPSFASGSVSGSTAPDIAASAKAWQDTDTSKAEEDRKRAEIEKIKEERKLAAQRAKESIQNIAESRSRQRKMKAEERRIKEEADNLWQKTINLANEYGRITQETRLLSEKAQTEQSQRALYGAKESEAQEMAEQLRENAKILRAKYHQLSKIADVYKGPAGTIIAYLKTILDSLNIGTGVIVPLKGAK
jgi:hypothetical protein